MQEKLWIENKKYHIPGVFVYPDEQNNFPCMILCHGTGSHKDEAGNLFAELAAKLVEKGIASLRFDFAGCGDSKANQQELTFYGEVCDTKMVYEFLGNHPKVDKNRIGILGFSQGSRVMAESFKEIQGYKCAVSWSGACHNGFGIFGNLFGNYYNEAMEIGFARIPMDWRDDLLISKEWFEEIIESKPMEGFDLYKGPVLCVAGKEDTVVEYHHSEDIYERCSNENSKLLIYDNADHIYKAFDEDTRIKNQVIKDTVKWIVENIV